MTDSDLTLAVLREIRDSIRTLDANLSSRIDKTNERIDVLTDHVDDRIDALAARTSLVEYAVRDAGQQIMVLTRYLEARDQSRLSRATR